MAYTKIVIAVAAVPGMSVSIGLTSVEAHKGATGIVKQRMMAMEDMGAIMKQWGAIRKGKGNFEPVKIKAQAKVLEAHAAEMPKLFPKGSIKGPSEATAAIWQNWSAFSGIARDMEKYAVQLQGEAGGKKSTAFPVMVQIGGTCSGCHKDYRKEKK